MSASLLRTSALRAGASAPRSSMAGLAGTSFVRTKATLPDLACRFTLFLYTYMWKLRRQHNGQLP